MNEMINRDAQRLAAAQEEPACSHNCDACLTDFEQTQRQVEDLRSRLLQENLDHQQLWLQMRTVMRGTLTMLVPASRVAGVPGESDAFRAGWDHCRMEIDRRVQELLELI